MESNRARSEIAVGQRDICLLRLLYECRGMTRRHIAALCFDGRTEAAKKRLQRLKSAGLLEERRYSRTEPGFLALSVRGLDALRNSGGLAAYPNLGRTSQLRRRRPSERTLDHDMAVLDLRCSLTSAIQALAGAVLVKFVTWPDMIRFGEGADVVKPDGLCVVRSDSKEHWLFVEVDRSTRSLRRLAAQAAAYRRHFRTGGFAKSRGAQPSAFREFPFRVLYLVKSAARRENLARALLSLSPPISTLVWIALHDDAVREPLGPVWLCPADIGARMSVATRRRLF